MPFIYLKQIFEFETQKKKKMDALAPKHDGGKKFRFVLKVVGNALQCHAPIQTKAGRGRQHSGVAECHVTSFSLKQTAIGSKSPHALLYCITFPVTVYLAVGKQQTVPSYVPMLPDKTRKPGRVVANFNQCVGQCSQI